MKIADWGAYFRDHARAFRMTEPTTNIADDLAALELSVTEWSARIAAHPRIFAFIGSVVGYFFPADRALIAKIPGILAWAKAELPTAIWVDKEIQPAATGIEGDDHSIGRG